MLTFSIEETPRSKALLQWLARTRAIILALFPVFNETVMAAEDAPDTVQEVASSIQDTILAIWADFVDRIPFLIAGLVVLLLTWLAAMLLSKVFDRLLHSISIYWYMPAEQLSPRLAGDNKILVNDISIKGSSKPTDTKNREQQILLKISGHQQR